MRKGPLVNPHFFRQLVGWKVPDDGNIIKEIRTEVSPRIRGSGHRKHRPKKKRENPEEFHWLHNRLFRQVCRKNRALQICNNRSVSIINRRLQSRVRIPEKRHKCHFLRLTLPQSKFRRGQFCPRSVRSLGRRKQAPLGHGCLLWRGPEPGADRLRRRKPAPLRRLTLNLLKREQTKKRGIRGKMRNASWDHSYLLRLLAVQPKEI